MKTHPFFATAPRGMTDLAADELRALGAGDVRETRGGASFEGTLETAYRACLWSRIANRILLPIAEFNAPTTDALYEHAARIDWQSHLSTSDTFAIDANLSASSIDHSQFAALRVKDAIADSMIAATGERPSVDRDRPSVRINLHIQRDAATVYIDLSGSSLNQRGYRLAAGAAPLKENLAAAILMRARWPEIAAAGGAFVDPMCGSGTLVLEAALMAADIAPGLQRDYFGFMGWRQHQPEIWAKVTEEAIERRSKGLSKLPALLGFDSDRTVLERARENADRLQLGSQVSFAFQDVSDFKHDFSSTGLVATNPPYGRRLLESGALPSLYQDLGKVLQSHFNGWKAVIFTEDAELGRATGLRSSRQHSLYNGAIACKLLHFDVSSDNVLRFDRLPASLEPGELSTGAEDFRNRLIKNVRQVRRWAKREGIDCYRVYDADLPDYAVAIDRYSSADAPDVQWICVQEYEAPKTVDERRAKRRLREARTVIQQEFGVESERLFFKVRSRQRGANQYQKTGAEADFYEVTEGAARLLVNFEDYLDTGLFLDHRPVRQRIFEEAADKRFLNLFSYTSAATVHAALGGARASLSVDLSNTYIEWSRKNFEINNIDQTRHQLTQADCVKWLKTAKGQFDLVFLDPPTFSNSKRMETTLDVQRDHASIIADTLRLLAPGGRLYFSTNLRNFRIDPSLAEHCLIEDITPRTIPFDYKRRPNIHCCFLIRKP